MYIYIYIDIDIHIHTYVYVYTCTFKHNINGVSEIIVGEIVVKPPCKVSAISDCEAASDCQEGNSPNRFASNRLLLQSTSADATAHLTFDIRALDQRACKLLCCLVRH